MPGPALSWGRYFSEEVQGQGSTWATDETLDTRNGGGSLPGSQTFGGGVELFSSEGNSSFKGGGVVEMDLGGGSPGAGVELVTCEAQLPGASSLLDRTSGHLQHLLLLLGGDLQAVSKTTTAALTSVTQVVVIFVLY